MGGSTSKEVAAVSNGSAISSDDDSDDGTDFVCSFPGFAFFCPPGSGSRGKKAKGKYDPMGTPLIDTPPATKRKLREAAERALQDNHQYLSRYSGLEKETSTRNGKGRMSPTESETDRELHGYKNAKKVPVRVHEGRHGERDLIEKYDLCEVLGVGSTSTCHRCIERSTGISYACKIIDKVQIEQRFAGMIDQFHTEIKALQSLHHPNIIKLYDVYITNDKIYIVMELMQGGELFDYVVQKGTLNEEEASRIVRKVTSALVYMHSKNIIHRDLKPENLLLTHKPRSSHDIEVKIIDFGLSKCMSEPVARSFLGTRGYLAPEMLQRRDYSREVDAWALGVIVFVLVCGCLPFDDDSQSVPTDDAVRARFVLRFPRWAKNLSPSAKDLLSHLLDVNPITRYTAEQALEHPWVRGQTAPRDNLLMSPGKIRPSPKATGASPAMRQRAGSGGRKASGKTRNHVAAMHASRAESPRTKRGSRQLVRKTSI